ncbi:MAG: exodeoxyribonuclease VII large subunit [Thermomicrobiales bacterium]
MPSHIYPVSTINSYIHDVVTSDELLADVWIEGEITKIYVPRSGHIYFTLCEGNASIDAVMWKSAAARQRFVPGQGESVVIHGQADYYQVQGRLQIQADVFEHLGQGMLSLEFERLRQRLEADGLFDESRKRPIPAFPRRIGVVTSSTGAVWHDIQTVARRRYPLVELVLIPSAVQGDRAPEEIAAAIRQAEELGDLDALIVGRGGGSPEDLAPFNSELVARAVFASSMPVVSAVGHETDVSICDMVADLRAATPSAAAELLLPDAAVLLDHLHHRRRYLTSTLKAILGDHELALKGLDRRIRLQSPAQQIARQRMVLDLLAKRARASTTATIERSRLELISDAAVLDALNPTYILKRGFAMVQDAATGHTVRSADSLPPGGEVIVRFPDGRASGTLSQLHEEHPANEAGTIDYSR